jgi:hypothetical protein
MNTFTNMKKYITEFTKKNRSKIKKGHSLFGSASMARVSLLCMSLARLLALIIVFLAVDLLGDSESSDFMISSISFVKSSVFSSFSERRMSHTSKTIVEFQWLSAATIKFGNICGRIRPKFSSINSMMYGLFRK